MEHPARPGAAVNGAWCYWTEILLRMGQFESGKGWKIRLEREAWLNGAESMTKPALRQVTKGVRSRQKTGLVELGSR